MSLHEWDKVEGGHFHKAAREDADDAQEVHGHGDSKKAKELDPACGGETGPGRKLVEGTMVVPAVLNETDLGTTEAVNGIKLSLYR